jgi:hypothetical protein
MGPQSASGASIQPVQPVQPVQTQSIQDVLRDFLLERGRDLAPPDFRLYRHVVLFLELCIGNYGHRNLDEASRERYERLYRDPDGGREFFEIFGPEFLVPELDFFTGVFLKKEVITSERIVRKAADVVSDLREWLVAKGHLTEKALEEQEERTRAREKLRRRLRPLARRASREFVSLDPSTLAEEDSVGLDDHRIGRVEPGRVWLLVHRTGAPEEIGPLALPEELTRHLRTGWTLCCSLGRLRGRWRFLELSDIHPCG